jgi:hypothetical protein
VTNIFVFVATDAPDRRLAEEVARILLEQGVGYSMPLERGNPEEIRADLEDNLRTCDGLLIIYGETTASWVRSQLRQCRKVVTQREQPLSALAVYEGPPPEKIALDFMLPNLQRLDCRRGLDHSRLRAFVDSLRG